MDKKVHVGLFVFFAFIVCILNSLFNEAAVYIRFYSLTFCQHVSLC